MRFGDAPLPRRRDLVVATVAIFGVVWLLHALSPVEQSFDSVWLPHTAHSVLTDGDADLREYDALVTQADDWKIERTDDGALYHEYPTGVVVSALPFVAVARVVDPNLDDQLAAGPARGLEIVIGSFWVAAATAVIYLLAVQVMRRPRVALGAALVFAFCTSAWSTASRAAWQHGPSLFWLALGLLAVVAARDDRRWGLVAGLALGMAYATRPTNAVVVAVFTVYVVVALRRALVPFLAGGAAVAVALAVANLVLFDAVLPSYYDANALSLGSTVPTAAAGNLVSPGRGLFVYTPVFLASIAGAWMLVRRREWDALDTAVACAAVAPYVVHVFFPHWWGGWSYGPRFLTESAPFAVWFLFPVLAWAQDHLRSTETRDRVLLGGLGLVIVVSFFMHATGALSEGAFAWNRAPSNVDYDEGRLWDWSDPPFLR